MSQRPRSYDVVVCGGGIAGIAAALAAARQGASTALVEREYAPGGLATLGLIIIYLPLCDGAGQQMSGGLAETLLHLSLAMGPGEIPEPWRNPQATAETRSGQRFQAAYQAAPMILAAEQALLDAGVNLFYGAQISGIADQGRQLTAVRVETKQGREWIRACCVVDATGDADICYFADEPTVTAPDNRRTGWYFSHDGQQVQLHQLTDPLTGDPPPGSRFYDGTDLDDISQHVIDGRQMIAAHAARLRREQGLAHYPLLIPAFHGLRMTRRLAGPVEFSDDRHEGGWFPDAIGMIGNWKQFGKRYSLPYRALRAVRHDNLYAAGRCISADRSGWDLTRVIPSCAVSGEAAGTAAALQALQGLAAAPETADLQAVLRGHGVLLRPDLFDRVIEE